MLYGSGFSFWLVQSNSEVHSFAEEGLSLSLNEIKIMQDESIIENFIFYIKSSFQASVSKRFQTIKKFKSTLPLSKTTRKCY